MEGISFAFLYAMMTGRAFVSTLDVYNLNIYFNNPGLDWEYHLHPKMEHEDLFLNVESWTGGDKVKAIENND